MEVNHISDDEDCASEDQHERQVPALVLGEGRTSIDTSIMSILSTILDEQRSLSTSVDLLTSTVTKIFNRLEDHVSDARVERTISDFITPRASELEDTKFIDCIGHRSREIDVATPSSCSDRCSSASYSDKVTSADGLGDFIGTAAPMTNDKRGVVTSGSSTM
jgi:hypothetical protein